MLVFKPCENLLLFPPKFFTTTNSKPHLHLHHHDVKLLHFSPLKTHFKSTLSSSSSPLSSAAPAPAPSEEDSSSSSTSLTTSVDFLMDSCGLSNKQALEVIRQVPTLLQHGDTKPRSVITYFESIGFSKTHISKLISKYPDLLRAEIRLSNVEKTLKPKIQLFMDFGFSQSDIADLITLQPFILRRGLKTHLKPALAFIKSIVKTDDDLIKTIKLNSFFLLRPMNHKKWIVQNMDVLRKHGVPESEILHLFLSRLQTLILKPKVFKSIVERSVSLGFKPETKLFSTAVLVMSGMEKATWDSKFELLKGLGWLDAQILDSFIRCPTFFSILSCENMKESIGFFKESLNWDASFLSQHPMILNFSLKKRVIPRYAVLKCLMSKEIIKEDKIFVSMLTLNETEFLSKYVFEYQDQLPYLYEVYKKECMLGCEEEDNGLISIQQDHGDVDVTV